MAEAKWCGQDSRARIIPHNDLPHIADNFVSYRDGRLDKQSTLGFSIEKQRILSGVLCPHYYNPLGEEELRGMEHTNALLSVAQLVKERVLSINTGDEIGKLDTEPVRFRLSGHPILVIGS